MLGATPIPENRELSRDEASLVQWMLENGAPEAKPLLPQLSDARVISRCSCGCASVDFAIGDVIPSTGSGLHILGDFEYASADGHLCGAFVFAKSGMLAGLEVWSIDGLSTPSQLPDASRLRPLSH
jgi:hypothetical protein